MTLHIQYDHECRHCGAYCIPYDKVPCPRCGRMERKRFDFIPQAAQSALFNLRSQGCYVPAAWWVGSFADHLLLLLFRMLERHREDASRPFEVVAREEVERMEWGEQEYGKEHLYAMALRVYEEIGRLKGKLTAGRQTVIFPPAVRRGREPGPFANGPYSGERSARPARAGWYGVWRCRGLAQN